MISQGKIYCHPNHVMDTTDYRNEVYPGVRGAGGSMCEQDSLHQTSVTLLVSCLEALQKTGLFLSVVRLPGITADR